jgi:RNA polymerase sigma-70 factor (sigma-E family)
LAAITPDKRLGAQPLPLEQAYVGERIESRRLHGVSWFHERAANREFERFVGEATDRLFRTAYLMTWDAGESEDLVQDVFVKVARRWARVRSMENPYGYARRMLVNQIFSGAARRTRVRGELELSQEITESVDDESLLAFDRVEDTEALREALCSLTERQRHVLVLRYWEDLAEADVAAMLRCSVGTVKSTASRAAARVADQLRLRSSETHAVVLSAEGSQE